MGHCHAAFPALTFRLYFLPQLPQRMIPLKRTFLQKGKAACHAKQIPEAVLYSTGAEVLGLDELDVEIFEKEITEILVPEFNTLIFVFRDGHTEEKFPKFLVSLI
jgi:hypothetical protein